MALVLSLLDLAKTVRCEPGSPSALHLLCLANIAEFARALAGTHAPRSFRAAIQRSSTTCSPVTTENSPSWLLLLQLMLARGAVQAVGRRQ